jgi:hypothetical protein
MSVRSNVAACAKHFVGDGGTTKGVDENNTVSNYKQLVNIHMTPYFDAIAKGVSTIMVSYSSWNGQKMHANRFLISHVLKKQLGFKVLLLCILIIMIHLGFVFLPFQKFIFCKTFNQLFYNDAFLYWSQGFVISDWQGIDRITSPPGANYSLSVLMVWVQGLTW